MFLILLRPLLSCIVSNNMCVTTLILFHSNRHIIICIRYYLHMFPKSCHHKFVILHDFCNSKVWRVGRQRGFERSRVLQPSHRPVAMGSWFAVFLDTSYWYTYMPRTIRCMVKFNIHMYIDTFMYTYIYIYILYIYTHIYQAFAGVWIRPQCFFAF